MKSARSKSVGVDTEAKFAVFDIMPLSEFANGKSKLGCYDRHQQLKKVIPSDSKALMLIDKVECNLSTAEGQATFRKYNKDAIAKGFEGIMIKDRDAIYECKRSSSMLKAKPVIEVSLTVKAMEEGTGKAEGMLGAFICEGKDDGTFIRANVGSGLTDEQRIEFWSKRDTIVGRVIEVRADAITQNQNVTDEYSLRFPRFIRFRGFEKGEKF